MSKKRLTNRELDELADLFLAEVITSEYKSMKEDPEGYFKNIEQYDVDTILEMELDHTKDPMYHQCREWLANIVEQNKGE